MSKKSASSSSTNAALTSGSSSSSSSRAPVTRSSRISTSSNDRSNEVPPNNNQTSSNSSSNTGSSSSNTNANSSGSNSNPIEASNNPLESNTTPIQASSNSNDANYNLNKSSESSVYQRIKKRPISGVINSDADAELTCPICFDLIDVAHVTKCGHSFCQGCIQTALEHTHRCPKCNTPCTINKDVFPNFTCKQNLIAYFLFNFILINSCNFLLLSKSDN